MTAWLTLAAGLLVIVSAMHLAGPPVVLAAWPHDEIGIDHPLVRPPPTLHKI